MEKSDSFTLDDAMQLLRGNEDDYTIGVASSFGVDQEKFEQESTVQAKIAMLRATQRQSVFAVMRTEKQMGTLAFGDVEKSIELDPEHHRLLDQCRSMKEYIHARIDQAVEVATEEMPPRPTGLFNFTEKKKWDAESGMRLAAQKILFGLEATLSRTHFEAQDFILAHMMHVHAGRAFPTFEQLVLNVTMKYTDLVLQMAHIERLLKMDHFEDTAYLRFPEADESASVSSVDADIVIVEPQRKS